MSDVSFVLSFPEFKQAIGYLRVLSDLSDLVTSDDSSGVLRMEVGEEDVRLYINRGSYISTKVPLAKPTENRGVILAPLDTMLKLVSTSKEISFDCDGSVLKLVSGKLKVNVPLASHDSPEEMSMEDGTKFVAVSSQLLQSAAQMVDFSTVLDGHSDMLLSIKGGKLSCWSHNSWHAAIHTENVGDNESDFQGVFNAKIISRFAQIARAHVVEFAFSDSKWMLKCPILEIVHPSKSVALEDLRDVFGRMNSSVPQISTNVTKLLEELASVTSFDTGVQTKTSYITLTVQAAYSSLRMICKTDTGEAESSVTGKLSNVNADVDRCVNFRALLGFLGRFRKNTDVTLAFHEDRILLTSADGSTNFMLALVEPDLV